MIASSQTLRKLKPVSPFFERGVYHGLSYGLGPAGYDIRIAQDVNVTPNLCVLASTIEYFCMPDNLLGVVHDKSTWARRGLCVQNTVIEPGWRGFLTLELTNHSASEISLIEGIPIAQVVFHLLDEPTDIPYEGKYQDQPSKPVKAIEE